MRRARHDRGAAADRAGWEALWNGCLEFYRVELPPEVTEATWRRPLDPGAGMHGLCAAGDAGEVDGVVHCFFHPVTWAIAHRCYLEDLFAKPPARRTGIGRRLVEAVYARRTRKSPTGLLAYGGRQRDCAAALRSREPFDGSREVVTSARPTPLLRVFAASPTARASPPREAEVPSPERLRLSWPPPGRDQNDALSGNVLRTDVPGEHCRGVFIQTFRPPFLRVARTENGFALYLNARKFSDPLAVRHWHSICREDPFASFARRSR